MCELCADPTDTRSARLHNRSVARSAPSNHRLEVGPDVAAVLRPEEGARLREVLDLGLVHCTICGGWIEPGSRTPMSVSASLDGDRVAVELAHVGCSPSRADLAALVVVAQAEPLGINYVQARHPEAGAVLLWERKLDLRLRGPNGKEECLYLDPDWWEGFHGALADEPVRLLVGWLLAKDGEDLVLRHGERVVERFHGAIEGSPAGWLESLEESGFCLLVVGAGIGLERPEAAAIQRAIRERRAVMGLAEFDV
jgi:hypothetical protein